MSLLHRGLKLCPYGKPLLQGLSINPESKGPDKHSQLKIFFLSQYIYKIGTELRKLFNQDSPYYLLQNKPLFSVWHTLYGSLRRSHSLTSVSNICEPVPISLFWAPNGFNELPGVRFEFPFNLIGKLTVVFLTGQSSRVLNSTQWYTGGAKNTDFGSVSQTDVTRIQFRLWRRLAYGGKTEEFKQLSKSVSKIIFHNKYIFNKKNFPG